MALLDRVAPGLLELVCDCAEFGELRAGSQGGAERGDLEEGRQRVTVDQGLWSQLSRS